MKKIILFLYLASPLMAQDFLPLYPAGIPNSKPVANKQTAERGADWLQALNWGYQQDIEGGNLVP
ncbi:MAG: hypothetical protein ACKOUQ_01700 [Aquirufa sp.]